MLKTAFVVRTRNKDPERPALIRLELPLLYLSALHLHEGSNRLTNLNLLLNTARRRVRNFDDGLDGTALKVQ
jgi:hypothetical protein